MAPVSVIAAFWQPITKPSHVLNFSDIGELYSAALSPDGSRLYVLVHGTFIDVGAVVAQYWPEWGGVLAGLLALPLLFMLVRRLRREQRDGDPYCRRCNYNLSTQTPEARCPECGLDLTKRPPIPGRRAWKRAAPAAILLALVLGAYGGMWAFRVARGAEWLNPGWSSSSALKLIDRKGFDWLKKYRTTGDVVVEVDASTGERRRTVCGRTSSTHFHLVMTPDGSGFYLNRADRNGVDLVSTSSGRTRASFQPAPPTKASQTASRGEFCYEIGGNAIIGHTKDSSVLLSYWSDTTHIASATLWNPATGEVSHIATTPAYIDSRTGRNYCAGRQFVRVGEVEPVQVISVPLFMEAFPTTTYEVRWFGPMGQARAVDLKTSVSSHGLPVVTPDGELAIFGEQYGRQLISIDMKTGEEAGRVDTGDPLAMMSPVLAPDGVRLLVGFSTIKVRDIKRREWIATLEPPTGYYGARALTSPRARRVAAVFQGDKNGQPVVPPAYGRGQTTYRAAIWDLPSAENKQ